MVFIMFIKFADKTQLLGYFIQETGFHDCFLSQNCTFSNTFFLIFMN